MSRDNDIPAPSGTVCMSTGVCSLEIFLSVLGKSEALISNFPSLYVICLEKKSYIKF